MSLEVKGNKLVLNATLKKGQTYTLTESAKGTFLSIYNKPKWACGVSSMCADGKHVLFLDYDNVSKQVVLTDILTLSVHCRQPFYLFSTRQEKVGDDTVGNYHVICLEKQASGRVLELMRLTHCDSNYVTMPLRNAFRSWVLRTSKKGSRDSPKFLMVTNLVSPSEVSTAHMRLLHQLYPSIPKLQYPNQDKSRKVYLNAYETLSRVN